MSKLEIPSSWAEAKVNDLAERKGGGTPSRKKHVYFTGNIPWITVADIPRDQDGVFTITGSRESITSKAIQESSTHLIPKNSIILSTRVSVGKVGINAVDLCTNQDFSSFVNCKIDTRFFANYLFLNKSYFLREAKGATIQGISLPIVTDLVMPIPPLGEQKRIVAKIELAQEKIKTIEQSVTNAEKLIGKLALSFLNSRGTTSTTIKDSFEERVERFGKTSAGETALVGVSNETGVTPLRSDKKVNKTKYKWVRHGDVFYNPMRLNVGSVALFLGDTPAITSPDYIVIKPKDYSSGWVLFWFLKSAIGQGEIQKRTKGSVRERVYFDNLASIPFYKTTQSDSILIDKCTIRVETLKTQIKVIAQSTNQMFDALLRKAFSGALVSQDPSEGTGHELLENIKLHSKVDSRHTNNKPKPKKRVKT